MIHIQFQSPGKDWLESSWTHFFVGRAGLKKQSLRNSGEHIRRCCFRPHSIGSVLQTSELETLITTTTPRGRPAGDRERVTERGPAPRPFRPRAWPQPLCPCSESRPPSPARRGSARAVPGRRRSSLFPFPPPSPPLRSPLEPGGGSFRFLRRASEMGGTRRHAGELLRSALPGLLLLLLEAQASVQPSRSERPGQCRDSNEYYDQTARRCCHFCPPGFRVRYHCNKTSNTQCEACEENTYTNSSNSAIRCLGCSATCREGLVEIQKCTRTQDRQCRCPPHEFCSTVLFETCYRCQPHQRCQKGYGVAEPGTGKSNVKCAPCGPGMFSDVESSSATCRPHRVCGFQLFPGNSTNDAVCKNFSIPRGIPVTSRQPTVKETPFQYLLMTSTPKVDMGESQKKLPTDFAYIIGGLMSGLFLVVAFIGAVSCIVSRRKALQCKQLFGAEKQPFSATGKGSDKWPRVSSPAGQEEENLLKISPSSSGSLDYPPASDKSSGISDLENSRKEVETGQQRSSPSSSCTYHSQANSKQPGSGGTHVNISCVVNVCNPGHSLQLPSSAHSSAEAAVSEGEDLPLAEEESPIQRVPERQTAIEVEEDNMDTFSYEEGKPLPLSVQDVGMKTR